MKQRSLKESERTEVSKVATAKTSGEKSKKKNPALMVELASQTLEI